MGSLPENIRADLEHLSLCFHAIPLSLPLFSHDARINGLCEFELDRTWLADIGEDGEFNRNLECAFFENPRNDDGIFDIKGRGPAWESLPIILERWLGGHSTSVLALKWLGDAIASIENCLHVHGVKVCCHSS